jgi:peptide/nickel transport system ATP-binding protein
VSADHHVRCVRWQGLSVDGRERSQPTSGAATAPEPRRNGDRTDQLLEVKDLIATYRRSHTGRPAVAGVSFAVEQGRCVALVGESGSGKTTIGRCIAGLHVPAAGTISFDGAPIAGTARKRPLEVRRRIQIVFQNPFESLNPRQRVRSSIIRPLRVLRRLSRAEAEREVGELLERVKLPARLGDRFPVELSGGERQRVAIARALAAKPDLLVCDEITSALDVSVQAAVLELLTDLQRDLSLSMLFITHNLGVVAAIGDSVLVMDQGSLCEIGPVDEVLSVPTDDYTRRLIAAAPRLPDAALR